MRGRTFGIVGVVLFIGVYVASTALYAYNGMGRATRPLSEGQPATDGTKVTVDLDDVQSNNSVLVVSLSVAPGAAMLDPVTHGLNQDLTVVVTSAITPVKRIWVKGQLPGTVPVSLSIMGDPADWPFDRYRTGSVQVEIHPGDAPQPERTSVAFVNRLPGWKVEIPPVGNPELATYRVQLHRAPSTAAFAVVIMGVLLSLAGMALFVAIQTARDRRKFQPPMTTWYAAMLFAVMPLRNALPDAPPFGAWIDVAIVLWVIVALVIAMVLYISCWWRQTKPENPTGG